MNEKQVTSQSIILIDKFFNNKKEGFIFTEKENRFFLNTFLIHLY